MLHPHPLTALSVPTTAFVTSAMRCIGLHSYERYSPVGPAWIKPTLNHGKTLVLEISATTYTHSVRDGSVFGAVVRPDGSILSLERDAPGPLFQWIFRDHTAFLHRDGECSETTLHKVIRVGDTLLATIAHPYETRRDENHAQELCVASNGSWKSLNVFGDNIAHLDRIADDLFIFENTLYRWNNDTHTRVTDTERCYDNDNCIHINDTIYILNRRKLARLESDGTITDVGWPAENLMGLWEIEGLIFTVLGDNKRSWIAALYDPKTGKSRGFKRKDFGLERHEGSNQWITAHGRLFFLTTTTHFEIDLPKLQTLRRTRLRT